MTTDSNASAATAPAPSGPAAPVNMTVEAALQLAQQHRAAGRHASAVTVCQDILRAVPEQPMALFMLGVIALNFHRGGVAEQQFRAVLARNPNDANAWAGLSSALHMRGRTGEAEEAARKAVQLDPGNAQAHAALGRLLLGRARHAEATAAFASASELEPRDPSLMSGMLYSMVQDEAVDAQALAQAHRRFGERYGSNPGDRVREHANVRDPDKRLRVGFVSGDLRRHAVAYFIEPVWREFDRSRVELYAYANQIVEDATSQRLKPLVDHWCRVDGLGDAALAERIRADAIDILIDLSGHTEGNRLLALARKPAPVQASWIGYPETTGLAAIDYHLCNVHAAPPGGMDEWYVEKLVRLQASGAFEPDPRSPEVNPLPASQRGFVTFGSMNRLSKFGASVVPTWSRVLLGVPGSRMLIGNVADPRSQQDLTERFAAHGIEAERLRFSPPLPMEGYLGLHHEIDILLDTFPYTSGTTAKHALWMGVPVVTLAGPRRSERGGTANVTRIGLGDWSVESVADYVGRAIRAAEDLPALAALRAGLRGRITGSPLRRPANVARSLEFALRAMWRRWCAGLPPEAMTVTLEQALQDVAAKALP
jgi:protein O-GlcNAc transferase